MTITTQFGFSEGYEGRTGSLQDLMRHRVQNILFVSSLYESFIMAEDGQLNELILSKFLDMNLSQAPNLTRVSSGADALALAQEQSFDVLITSLQLGDMNAGQLARRVRAAGLALPVMVLAYDHRELKEFENRYGFESLERVFIWQGDARILLAMVKYWEDKVNLEEDSRFGVPVLIVVEDSVRFYSSFLPVIYSEVMKLSQSVFSEGVNLYQRLLSGRRSYSAALTKRPGRTSTPIGTTFWGSSRTSSFPGSRTVRFPRPPAWTWPRESGRPVPTSPSFSNPATRSSGRWPRRLVRGSF
jgi:CheY-like chemotaxis protein